MSQAREPKVLICSNCGEEFVFTIGAQDYFADKGYTGDPKRCKSCHADLKKGRRAQQSHHPRTYPAPTEIPTHS